MTLTKIWSKIKLGLTIFIALGLTHTHTNIIETNKWLNYLANTQTVRPFHSSVCMKVITVVRPRVMGHPVARFDLCYNITRQSVCQSASLTVVRIFEAKLRLA